MSHKNTSNAGGIIQYKNGSQAISGSYTLTHHARQRHNAKQLPQGDSEGFHGSSRKLSNPGYHPLYPDNLSATIRPFLPIDFEPTEA